MRLFSKVYSSSWLRTMVLLAVAQPVSGPNCCTAALADDMAGHLAVPAAKDLPSPQQSPPALRLASGDKLRISVYERVGNAEDKWTALGRPVRPELDFFLHTEVSGEFLVQSDARVSVPMLGAFDAEGRSVADLATDLRGAFQKLVGRPALVNIEIVERQRVYVVGPVKQPGAFTYEAGLTPLHLVALAGGFQHNEIDRSAVIEALRQRGTLAFTAERLEQAVSEQEVLRAQLGDRAAGVPESLVAITGASAAQALIAEMQAQQATAMTQWREHQKSLALATEGAQRELDATRAQLGTIQDGVKMRLDRLDSLQKLLSGGVVGQTAFMQAKADLADAEERKAQARVGIAAAEQRLALDQADEAKSKSDLTTELKQKVAALQLTIDELAPTLHANTRIADVLRPALAANASAETVSFSIVRRQRGGNVTICADATTLLQPGDLVRIMDAAAPGTAAPGTAGPCTATIRGGGATAASRTTLTGLAVDSGTVTH